MLPEVADAATESPVLSAQVERLYGYALWQARRADEAGPHLQRSLELAGEVGADFEVALTLEALATAGRRGPKAKAESRAILDRLGVLSTPLVPLP